MKKTILAIISIILSSYSVSAQLVDERFDGSVVDSLEIRRDGGYMTVGIDMLLSRLKVSRNRAVTLTPFIVGGTDTLALPSVGVYGRTRWYHYLRNGGMVTGKDETSYMAGRRPDSLSYEAVVPYEEWMGHSRVLMVRRDYGCCRTLLSGSDSLFAGYNEPAAAEPYFPALSYIRPVADTSKHYSISGSAYIDFPVDRTVIYPDYRRNASELAKIRATIDSVRNDNDVTITSIWLKGYASPESPYAHNEELAKGRTEALVRYVQNLYHFGDGIIETEYEPEDWDGLRRFVEASGLEHREQILAMIDSSLEPDAKEWRIKSMYPDEYRFLLNECYPALRHTDYRVEYDIRVFSDVEEIKRVMQTQPQKLSLNEFYHVAQTYAPGTDEFNEVFEIAVRMYPDDETANLNAANTAMQAGNLLMAERYLARAGSSPEAQYARGVCEFLSGRYDVAEALLSEAMESGIQQAGEVLSHIEIMKDNIHLNN
ncbi:MAG: DUF3868 domain-containing protein [Bacteroidales bacterium]|nr:DUF3868 domain-containing protein [Bacteroidales bacterium]